MKKEITKLMFKAEEAVEKFLTKTKPNAKGDEAGHKDEDPVVHKEYKGYVASLGAALRTSGLIPTLAFYSAEKSEKENTNTAQRYKLLQAIAYCLFKEENPDRTFLINEISQKIYCPNSDEINRKKLKKWEKRITEASIAIKLAMRNFKFTEEEE